MVGAETAQSLEVAEAHLLHVEEGEYRLPGASEVLRSRYYCPTFHRAYSRPGDAPRLGVHQRK
jgi:hypothetical protein